MINLATRQQFTFAKSNKRVKNRTVLAPLTHNMSSSNGDLSTEEIAWLKACSAGGFGMIITAATAVSMTGRCWEGQPALITDQQQQSFAQIAKNAAAHNTISIVQLHHGGMRTERKFSTDEAVSPSHYPADENYANDVREISTDEIETYIGDFVRSAKRAYLAGMDGVEIHAAFNFLLSNFSNSVLNKRDDQWGSSFENRNRIIFEIVKRTRANTGRDFIIGVRLSPENYAHFTGIEITEQIRLSNALNDLDVDYIHMSLYDSFKLTNHIKDKQMTLLQSIKEQLSPEITLIIAGKIANIEQADEVIAQGADFVALGKAAIGNPDWVNKVNSGKKLIPAPFSIAHLKATGFTDASIEYMSGVTGLVKKNEISLSAA